MPSPFPGMDPWLESPRLFGDLHGNWIALLQETMQPQLGPNFVARTDRRRWIERVEHHPGDIVWRTRAPKPKPLRHVSFGDTRPLLVPTGEPEFQEESESYLKICRKIDDDWKVVTIVEVFSPVTKGINHDGRDVYRRRQRELLESDVNLVEIDLLRGGLHTSSIPYQDLKRLGDYDYHVCVSLSHRRYECLVYRFTIRDSLPRIAIPLAPDVPPFTIDLQPIQERGFTIGAFDRQIKYDDDTPVPPLAEEQQRWAREILSVAK